MGAQSAEPEQKLEFRFFRELRIRENSGDANSFRKLWSKSLSSAATVPRGSNAGSMRSMIASTPTFFEIMISKILSCFFGSNFRTFQIRALMLLLWRGDRLATGAKRRCCEKIVHALERSKIALKG